MDFKNFLKTSAFMRVYTEIIYLMNAIFIIKGCKRPTFWNLQSNKYVYQFLHWIVVKTFFDLQKTKTIVIEREFGFRCKITLVDDPCELDVTCDAFGNKIDQFLRRQNGEIYRSDAPPECRTLQNPNGCQKWFNGRESISPIIYIQLNIHLLQCFLADFRLCWIV